MSACLLANFYQCIFVVVVVVVVVVLGGGSSDGAKIVIVKYSMLMSVKCEGFLMSGTDGFLIGSVLVPCPEDGGSFSDWFHTSHSH